MITSEEAKTSLYVLGSFASMVSKNIKTHYDNIEKYISQNESVLYYIKRYFELKAKGITTEAEALEHRELLNKINEMVGIK